MHEVEVLLNSIDKVKNFVSITTKFDAEMDLISGRYTVDAKSIMGIFSMDLSKPLIFRVYEGKENVSDILNAISQYVNE